MAHVLAKDLRDAVLEYAIQGKLTTQNLEDGDVFALVKNATQLLSGNNIDGAKVKKKNIDHDIDETSFDIPDNWKWVRLGEVCIIARGGSPRPIKSFLTDDEKGINWIKIGDTEKNGKYISSTKEKIIPEGMKKSRYVKAGDFLLTNSMSFGRPYILKIDGCIHDGWLVISQPSEVFIQDYLYYLLSSRYAYNQFCGLTSGAVVQNLNSDKVANAIFPLPPIEEQQRIVDRVDELMAKIDEYEKLENQLVQLKEQFPKDMRDSLLQAGMMGRLTEQLTSDTSVETTLNHVKSQRDMVCNKKSVKQAKEKEVLFHLPSEWCLVKIEDVMSVLNGDRGKNYPSKSKLQRNGKHPFISALNLNNNEVSNDEKLLYLSEEQYNLLRAGKLKNNDRLMCIRGSLGKHAKFTGNTGAIASSLVILRVFENGLNQNYLDYFLDSALLFKQITKNDNGTAQPNLSAENLKKFMIPFPPIEEQQRIVDKLDEMLPLVDALAQMD